MPRHERGFYCSGECFRQSLLTNDTRHTDNAGPAVGATDGTEGYDSVGYKSWLAIGVEQLGRDVAGEVESDWMVQVVFCEGGARDPRVNTMPRSPMLMTKGPIG